MKASISQAELQATAVRLGIPDHPFVARRIARAYDLVETNKVTFVTDDISRVRSQYDPKAIYTVEVNHGNPAVTRLAKGKACALHRRFFACDRTRDNTACKRSRHSD